MRADGALDGVVAEINAAIIKEPEEVIPPGEHIPDLDANPYVTPAFPQLGLEPSGLFDSVPDLPPVRTRDPALHQPGLTSADEANSAGVMNPRDV
jgi:hypothetical protein